jgi:hypothetical protein
MHIGITRGDFGWRKKTPTWPDRWDPRAREIEGAYRFGRGTCWGVGLFLAWAEMAARGPFLFSLLFFLFLFCFLFKTFDS